MALKKDADGESTYCVTIGNTTRMESPFRNRHNQTLEITDLFRGREAFLVCGGPSANDLPLEKLNQRGVLIFSANNWPGVLPPNVRPHVWLFNDKPIKFHEALFHDPAILKFMPVTLWHRQKRGWTVYMKDPKNGKHIPSKWWPVDMPCSVGYVRNHEFNPETFLTAGSLCQGNDKKHALALHNVKDPKTKVKTEQPIPGKKPNGFPHVINTMFSAISLPYYLGVRTLYLVGCDFRMNVEKPYGFPQDKHRGGVIACNEHFRSMLIMFDALRPKFDQAGYKVFNCFKYSGLTSFPFKPFEECLDECRQYADFSPTLDTARWYDNEPVAK
jgi:hypothetical protein